VTSIAYRAEPPLPGWLATSAALVVGWILGGAATLALYLLARLSGAIGQPNHVDALALNEWPYSGNGTWSLMANLSVVLLVLLLTTIATAWWLRRSREQLSEGRLAAVLLLTGWLPLSGAGPAGGLGGFLIAVVLIRYWVARHQDHLPGREAVVFALLLAGVIASYGLLHPLWPSDGGPIITATQSGRSAMVYVHNAARTGVTLDRWSLESFIGGSGRFRPPLHVAGGADATLTRALPIPKGGCGTAVLGLHVRYRIFGITLDETVPTRVSLGQNC
jgi:hypothetical protein